LAKKEEQALLIFDKKIFGRIYSPKYEKGEWKSRTNRELEEMSKGENIVKWIKGQRISWLGHLERMEEERMPKKIFTQELEGTRRRGRPRKRWKEEVERDLQVLGVRKWRPKPTVGCNANGRKKRRRRRRRKTYLLFAYFLFYQKVAHSFDIQRITYAELGFIFLINVFGVW